MPLDTKDIRPLKGLFTSNLWENSHIGLPLTLFYSIEIPLEPFDSGHAYVEQPTSTSIVIEWIKFLNPATGQNEANWKNLVGNEYLISYDDDTGEGSIYLGSEHCQFNSTIRFLSLTGTTFDIELSLAVDFNIETINLNQNGQFSIKVPVDYQGLLLYDNNSLPTFSKTSEPMTLISNFVDKTSYEPELKMYENPHIQWRQLKPRI
ncbi:MAG: hypothetical protein KF862_14520 [Chitinophagaceae bacterium]|nr:hypothetical protein [Chitinophagaceae bacterium]